MGYPNALNGRVTIGQVPLMIFAYLGFSLFIVGFIMTILAYGPTDSYLMVMIQDMSVMAFLGPILLIIGTIMLFVSVGYCLFIQKRTTSDDYDDDYD